MVSSLGHSKIGNKLFLRKKPLLMGENRKENVPFSSVTCQNVHRSLSFAVCLACHHNYTSSIDIVFFDSDIFRVDISDPECTTFF